MAVSEHLQKGKEGGQQVEQANAAQAMATRLGTGNRSWLQARHRGALTPELARGMMRDELLPRTAIPPSERRIIKQVRCRSGADGRVPSAGRDAHAHAIALSTRIRSS